MKPSIAVSACPSRWKEAEKGADQLGLPLVPLSSTHFDYLLLWIPQGIGLQKKGHHKPYLIDFVEGKIHHRYTHPAKELLVKAIGIKPNACSSLIDTTAGWGQDSFMLAARGYHITMLERSPIVHLLLQDALERARAHPSTTEIAKRLNLIAADAFTWLHPHSPHDIIYLDPMFPERKKSAAVKKEMVILQDILGKEENAAHLFQKALTCASKRVVVKRPRLAPFIGASKPHFSITGKSSRFDIYLIT